MPTTRTAIREGNTSEYKQALMDEIYEAMRETIATKEGDRLMAITEHDEHAVAYGPLLGINRSDDMVQIQVVLGARQDSRLQAGNVQADRRAPSNQARRPTRGRADVCGRNSQGELVIRQRRDPVLPVGMASDE